MPTRIPERIPAPAQVGPGALASAWLAGLIVLAAIAGASGERGLNARGACATSAPAGATSVRSTAPGPGGEPDTAVRDMLSHD